MYLNHYHVIHMYTIIIIQYLLDSLFLERHKELYELFLFNKIIVCSWSYKTIYWFIFSYPKSSGLGEGSHRDNILRFIEQVLSLQGLEHNNVMSIIGMSVEDNCIPLGIYPMMEYGNLHSFLELSRVSPESCPLNVSTAVHLCLYW